MADPMLEQFQRAQELRPSFFRDVQRHVREVIQPQLEERDALLVENASLKQQIQQQIDNQKQAAKAKAPKADAVTA